MPKLYPSDFFGSSGIKTENFSACKELNPFLPCRWVFEVQFKPFDVSLSFQSVLSTKICEKDSISRLIKVCHLSKDILLKLLIRLAVHCNQKSEMLIS